MSCRNLVACDIHNSLVLDELSRKLSQMIGVLIHLTSFFAKKSHFLELREIPRIWKVQDKPCQCMSTYVERTNKLNSYWNYALRGPQLAGYETIMSRRPVSATS